MERCWILLGMMGSGKSSVGRNLAELAGREFEDTDQLLQRRLGRSIPQLFQIYGEDAFREHETSVLKSMQPGPIVLATGGGIVCREANWFELRRLGPTLYLRAGTQTLLQRLEQSKKRRPLLEVEGWRERMIQLLESRLPYYERADFTLDVDDMAVEKVAARAKEVFESR